jgi:hypothetical protein
MATKNTKKHEIQTEVKEADCLSPFLCLFVFFVAILFCLPSVSSVPLW